MFMQNNALIYIVRRNKYKSYKVIFVQFKFKLDRKSLSFTKEENL